MKEYPFYKYTAKKYQVVEPPAREPVTPDEFVDQARITNSGQQQLMQRIIRAARTAAETALERSLISQKHKAFLDHFMPVTYLRRPPLISVESVQYIDENDVLQTVPPSTYFVDVVNEPGYIRLMPGESWPSHKFTWDAIEINYTCGYGSLSTDVPEDIRAAILALCTAMYDQPAFVDPAGRNLEYQQLYIDLFGMNRMYV